MIASLSDFVSAVSQVGPSHEHDFFWRGHANSNYKLIPGIYRKDIQLSAKEHLVIKEALLRHPDAFADKKSFFEKLALLQHYEFPTRLLDVTENPMVALYFACKDAQTKDGEVILFKAKRKNVKYFDSDAVTILSAISYIPTEKFSGFNDELKRKISTDTTPGLNGLRDRIFRNSSQSAIKTLTNFLSGNKCDKSASLKVREIFNDCQLIQELLHEIKSEKPHFRSIIDPLHFNNAMICVKSRLDNQRISAQQGAFLLFGIKNGDKRTPSDFDADEENGIELQKFSIASSAKKSIEKSLSSFGISDDRMFPELMNSAGVIKNKLKY